MGLLPAGKGKKFPGGDPEPCGALASSCQGILLFCSNERAKPGHLCDAWPLLFHRSKSKFLLSCLWSIRRSPWDTKAALSGCTGGFAPLLGSAAPAGSGESPRSPGVLSSGLQLLILLPREQPELWGGSRGCCGVGGSRHPWLALPGCLCSKAPTAQQRKVPQNELAEEKHPWGRSAGCLGWGRCARPGGAVPRSRARWHPHAALGAANGPGMGSCCWLWALSIQRRWVRAPRAPWGCALPPVAPTAAF